MQARSIDRNPIRTGKNLGIPRVAGSLTVTRAFGDFYLKDPEMSMRPFKVRTLRLCTLFEY